MERLTERIRGCIKIKGCTTVYGDKMRKGAYMSSAIVRLSEYEDTGLSPGAVMELKRVWHAACKAYGINSIPMEENETWNG